MDTATIKEQLQQIAPVSYNIREDETKYVSWDAEIVGGEFLSSIGANNVCCFKCGMQEIWNVAITNVIYYHGTRYEWDPIMQEWEKV